MNLIRSFNSVDSRKIGFLFAVVILILFYFSFDIFNQTKSKYGSGTHKLKYNKQNKALTKKNWIKQCTGNDHAIIIKLKSRLGNHMFQYASSLGIAQRNGLVPAYYTQNPDWLRVFNTTRFVFLPKSCEGYKTFKYTQKNHANIYDDNVETLGYVSRHTNSNVILEGYWATSKYFKDIQGEIRQQFKFVYNVREEAKLFLKENTPMKFKGRDFVRVGVHVRLTDREDIWNATKKTFLSKAVSYYKKKHKQVLFVVCSDDIRAARKIFPSYTNVVFSEKFGRKPWIDMAVLTMCDHSIITVGSFSWWSGWLTGGDVVYYHGYPRFKGYPKEKRDQLMNDLYPSNWKPF